MECEKIHNIDDEERIKFISCLVESTRSDINDLTDIFNKNNICEKVLCEILLSYFVSSGINLIFYTSKCAGEDYKIVSENFIMNLIKSLSTLDLQIGEDRILN